MNPTDRHLGPQHEDLGERGIYHKGNRLNELTGREWVYASASVWARTYPPSYQHDLRSQHGGQKPPELCRDLIETFTKGSGRVLDPFMGVGGTLLGASICRYGGPRTAVGIEIEPRWAEIYREVCRREGLGEQQVLVGDSRQVLTELNDEFDLLLTDVPYWDMDRRRRSTGQFKRAGGPAVARAAPKLTAFNSQGPASRTEWLELLGDVFSRALPLLRPRAYVVVFIGDMYHSGRYHPLSAEVAGLLSELGLVLKANLIWYDVSKKLHVYGYRYEFIPSMIHQNILVLRKETTA